MTAPTSMALASDAELAQLPGRAERFAQLARASGRADPGM
jgi:hypothetical protein